MTLRVTLLDEVAITPEGAVPGRIVRPRQLASAVAYLVLHRHQPVTRDELADALWDDQLPVS